MPFPIEFDQDMLGYIIVLVVAWAIVELNALLNKRTDHDTDE